VALAIAVISIIVFEPSTNSTSMRGFMFRRAASSRYSSGVASTRNGLFLPLPAAITGQPMPWTKLMSSIAELGSSPAPSV